MGRVVLRTVWEDNIEWNLFSVQFFDQTVFGELHFAIKARSKLQDAIFNKSIESTR
jgi:hypothetical protein